MLDGVVKKLRGETGPDEWSQALFTLESIAKAARDVGDWEYAGRIGQQMLGHDPSYAGTHYALALVADHKGDTRTAITEFALARQHWQRADADLLELKQLNTWLKRHGQ